MNQDRFRNSVLIATGLFLLCTAPGLTRAQSGKMPTPKVASPGPQHQNASFPADEDFAGLQYTDEQKTEIDHIRQQTKANKDTVAKDDKLNADQKDAMLLGYTRMEYGQIYKVLTPEQRRQVQQKIHERQVAEKASQKKPPAKN
jgi:Spy/CpxP family protein refolding chaperone